MCNGDDFWNMDCVRADFCPLPGIAQVTHGTQYLHNYPLWGKSWSKSELNGSENFVPVQIDLQKKKKSAEKRSEPLCTPGDLQSSYIAN